MYVYECSGNVSNIFSPLFMPILSGAFNASKIIACEPKEAEKSNVTPLEAVPQVTWCQPLSVWSSWCHHNESFQLKQLKWETKQKGPSSLWSLCWNVTSVLWGCVKNKCHFPRLPNNQQEPWDDVRHVMDPTALFCCRLENNKLIYNALCCKLEGRGFETRWSEFFQFI
jgi:hypothetical protein